MQLNNFNQDYLNNYIVHGWYSHSFNHYIQKNYCIGDEDCLHVNVYTHTTDPEANLDVLVHIHGGAFMFGAGSSYGPNIIMDRPIVFVNLNYRLGPLGAFTVYIKNHTYKNNTRIFKY